jgi:arylsulfatase A-like enzyme
MSLRANWIAVLITSTMLFSGCAAPPENDATEQSRPPNVIIIFADDLGYGDLASYGHPTIRTPNLDRMASEGQRWTHFYVGESVCSPSRAALLTGRLPIRTGMFGSVDRTRVLFPDSPNGLPADEVTIAEMLKEQGYATAAIGKWHLGHLPEFLPQNHGFDTWLGLPYSNDMDMTAERDQGFQTEAFYEPKSEYWNVPLMRNEEVIERPADQTTLTKRYTEEAVRFIESNKDHPFFLYLPHTMPHIPLFRSGGFAGKSLRGLYGDVIEEIDWSVGQILETLRRHGLAEQTLVVFTSDNGPWLTYKTHGGSAGGLKWGKGTTWEGGMRVPAIFWWPGTVKPGTVMDMGSTLDLLPTVAQITGAVAPTDRVLDGFDLTTALIGTRPSPRNTMFYYRGAALYAVRLGPFKAHFITEGEYGAGPPRTVHSTPLLYHLGEDPGEQFDVADAHPEVIAEILELVEEHRENLDPQGSLFDLRPPAN